MVLGGFYTAGPEGKGFILNTVEKYDIFKGLVQTLPPLPEARYTNRLSSTIGGNVILLKYIYKFRGAHCTTNLTKINLSIVTVYS